MKVNEIFKSIQGESTYMGVPTLFIRTSGCDLRCSYCDTKYAYNEGKEISIDELLKIIDSYNSEYIEITGGEPLLQKDTPLLIDKLIDKEYKVIIETGGHHDIGVINKNAIIVMDLKCPSSNESKKNDWRNIDKLKKDDQIKFVIGTREDYEWSKKIIEKCNLTRKAIILMSVVYEKLKSEVLIEWILEDNLRVRFQPQLHKLIWGNNVRGK
jgi:7-carboxy-7-deazaguanine synthase